MFTLQTNRLLLRDFTAADFPAFYANTTDPEHQRFYSERETTPEFTRHIFDMIRGYADAAERTKYQLAICLPTGELIGTCGVRTESEEHRNGSYGCGIGRPYWGQGYAYEASHTIINFGFIELGLHRIYAETISENVRASALAERLGMKLEGELREAKFFNGRWWDVALYAVLENEWNRQQTTQF